MAISTISFTKTPQAGGDTYLLYEDQLLGLTLLDGKIVALDVMSNDLGGGAKALYSADDGLTYNAVSSPNDLLLADALISGKSVWEATQSTVNGVQATSDDVLRIDNGKIDLDISHSLLDITGTSDINALAAGDHIHDSFIYAIRLGNGTLSWATTTVDVYGENDAAAISGIAVGTLTEDTTTPVTGTLTVTDADHGEAHTQTTTNTASLGGFGTYSVDADGHWSYTVNAALVQYLNADQSITDTFVVESLDGTAHQTVTITITGIDDATGYTYTILDAPGTYPHFGAFSETLVTAISPTGSVAGYGFPSSGGFIFDGSSYTTIGNLGTNYYPQAINAAGEIAGSYVDEAGQHGFIFDGSSYITLDVPGAVYTEALGINAAGEAVGTYQDAGGQNFGFLYDSSHHLIFLNAPGSSYTIAQAINADGEIAGFYRDSTGQIHGFLYDENSQIYQYPDDPLGSISTYFLAINGAGEIAGYYEDGAGVLHGFTFDGIGYTTLDPVGSTFTVPMLSMPRVRSRVIT
jgi:VCBS repeat-containing protein/probable HAF family extracellular repeat protein